MLSFIDVLCAGGYGRDLEFYFRPPHTANKQKQITHLFCVHNKVHFIVTTVYLEVLVSVSKLPHECAIF